MTATETKKWTAGVIGPRQLKAFNEALSAFGWEAKAKTEITDFGRHDFVEMIGGSWQPEAAPALEAIKEKYNYTVTGANYQAIVTDLKAATAKLKETRPVIDRRTSPEERAERDQAREQARQEREAKERAEAERIAGMQTHEYNTVEAAAALKKTLGIIWPNVKFSVKSERYSGGYSVTPSWVDGPTGEQVRKITTWFENKHFDGMQDLETSTGPSEWANHRFNIRGGYVHGSRNVSADLLRKCAERFTAETGIAAPAINTDNPKYPYVERTGAPCGWSLFVHDQEHPEGVLCKDECTSWTAADLVGQMSHHLATEVPAYPLERDTVFRILLGEITAPITEGSSVAVMSSDGVTISENDEKDGVEIRFADKPDQSVLDMLKANGWRWSRFSKCWYAKRSERALAFAQTLTQA